MDYRVAIIGAGKMGSALLDKWSNYFPVLIYNRDSEKILSLKGNNIIIANELDEVKKAKFIVPALPAEAVSDVMNKISLSEKNIIVNIATALYRQQLAEALMLEETRIISAKIIGHASEMKKGEKPVIVLHGEKEDSLREVEELFGLIGETIRGDEKIVHDVNKLTTRIAVKSVIEIEERLAEIVSEQKILKAVLSCVAPGVMKALARGEMGSFSKRIIEELKTGK